MTLLAALLLLPVPSCSAWSGQGHRIAARVAESRLSEVAKKRLKELLGRHTLADVSHCADEARRRAVSCGPVTLPRDGRSGPWHYIDIPIGAEPKAGELRRFCRGHGREDQCVTEQIKRRLAELRDPKTSLERRQVALVYVVHLVADLHQPLHAADDEDAGGNRKLVSTERGGRKTKGESLHRIWDGMLLGRREHDRLDPEAVGASLAKKSAAREDSGLGDDALVDAAALESFALAKTKIYEPYERLGGALGADYRAEMRPVAMERLRKAGVRLALLLERALVPAAS